MQLSHRFVSCFIASVASLGIVACSAPTGSSNDGTSATSTEGTTSLNFSERSEAQQLDCETCVKATCNEEMSECMTTKGCADLAVCTVNATNEAGLQECADAHPDFIAKFNALSSCNTEYCTSECGGRAHGGGTGPVKSYP